MNLVIEQKYNAVARFTLCKTFIQGIYNHKPIFSRFILQVPQRRQNSKFETAYRILMMDAVFRK